MLSGAWNSFMKNITPSNRFRIHVASNLMGCSKRCDPQSSCAKCARQVLNTLRAFHSKYPLLTLAHDGDQSVCERARADIFDILDVVHSCNHGMAVARQQSLSSKEGAAEEEGIHNSSSHAAKEVSSYRECYLSRYKCNVIALMILEEAMLTFQEEAGDISTLGAVDTRILNSLEFLINEFNKSPPYKSKVDIEMIDKKIYLFQLTFRGEGMKYLLELKKLKNSYLYT